MKTGLCKLALFAATLVASNWVLSETVASESVVVIDACEYPSTEAAQAAWKPIESRTPPVERIKKDGRAHLSLPLNFENNTSWRVAWDHKGLWDLSSCQTLRVHVTVEDDHPAAMSLYLHTGDGWVCGWLCCRSRPRLCRYSSSEIWHRGTARRVGSRRLYPPCGST